MNYARDKYNKQRKTKLSKILHCGTYNSERPT